MRRITVHCFDIMLHTQLLLACVGQLVAGHAVGTRNLVSTEVLHRLSPSDCAAEAAELGSAAREVDSKYKARGIYCKERLSRFA